MVIRRSSVGKASKLMGRDDRMEPYQSRDNRSLGSHSTEGIPLTPGDALATEVGHEVSPSEHFLAPIRCLIGGMSLLSLAATLHWPSTSAGLAGLQASLIIYLTTYPLVWGEAIWQRTHGHQLTWSDFAACLVPPLRLVSRDHWQNQLAYIPFLGWRRANETEFRRLERHLSWPMIAIALTALPLLAVEAVYQDQMASHPVMEMSLAAAQATIWAAFATELLVMLSLTDKKLVYCKKHWLDIVIVALPLLAAARFLRFGRFLKVQQVARATRMMRLKRVALRLFQALVLVDAASRFSRQGPAKRLEKLRKEESELHERLREIQAEIAETEMKLDNAPVEAGEIGSRLSNSGFGKRAA